jgi:hypothetical protein
MNPTVVRFVWRHASYSMGWSKSQQQLLIDEFVLVAEREVACANHLQVERMSSNCPH